MSRFMLIHTEEKLLEYLNELKTKAEQSIYEEWSEKWLANNNVYPPKSSLGNRVRNPIDFNSSQENGVIDVESAWNLEPAAILNHLQKLRNFTKEECHAEILESLSKGEILLFKADIKCFVYYVSSLDFGSLPCTVYFIRSDEDGVYAKFVNNAHMDRFSWMRKNWFYRAGKTVVLSTDDVTVMTFTFESVEEAISFETGITFIGELAGEKLLLRLYGEFPIEQLRVRGFDSPGEDTQNEVNVLAKTVNEEAKHCDPSPKEISTFKLTEKFRDCCEEYVRYLALVQIYMYKATIQCKHPEEVLGIWRNYSADIRLLLKLVVFCYLPPRYEKRSFSRLTEDLFYLLGNAQCISMIRRANEDFEEYVHKVKSISYHIVEALDDFDDNHLAVYSCLVNYISANKLDLSREMKHYLEYCKWCSEQPTLFDRLDILLRIGNQSVFDILFSRLKKEFVEILFHSSTVTAISKDLFGDRHQSIRDHFGREISDQVVRMSDLSAFCQINLPYRNKETLSVGESIVVLKINHCIAVLQDLINYTEKILHFDIIFWTELVKQRHQLEPNEDQLSNKGSNGETSVLDENASSEDSFEKLYVNDSKNVSGGSLFQSWQDYKKYEAAGFTDFKKLQSGAFASVDVLMHDSLGTVVCKEYNHDTSDEDREKEINMLIRLQSSSYIVRLYGFYYNSRESFSRLPDGILLEYIERSLDEFIYERRDYFFKHTYRLRTAIEQMRGMANAFGVMHELGVIHRDIKPLNLLLTYGDEIRVCDFGTCGEKEKTCKTFLIGTLRYMSPEMMSERIEITYTEKTDVFSLAVTMWEQIHRRKPYPKMKKNQKIMDFVCDGKRMKFDVSVCPAELQKVVESAWAQKPEDRPSMKKLEELLSNVLKVLSPEELQIEPLGPFRKKQIGDNFAYVEYDFDEPYLV